MPKRFTLTLAAHPTLPGVLIFSMLALTDRGNTARHVDDLTQLLKDIESLRAGHGTY